MNDFDQFIDALRSGGFDPKQEGPTSWKSRCPAHNGEGRSLGIAPGRDVPVVVTCRAHGCTFESIGRALGLHHAGLFDIKANGKPAAAAKVKVPKKDVAFYDYVSEAGEVLYQVVRTVPKDFWQRRVDPSNPGRWIKNMDGIKRVPYKLSGLISAIANGVDVLFVEGEKDSDTAESIGVPSTCLAGGSGWGKHVGTVAEHFRGAHLVVISDKDVAGRKYAGLVAAAYSPVTASLKLIELPDIGEKPVKDLSDFVAAGGTKDQLGSIVDAAPEWTPDTIKASDSASEYLPNASELAETIKLTVRRPFEIMSLPVDPDDNLLGDRLLSKGNSLVILGPGGCHKSRLLLQLAACSATGRDFHGLPTHAAGKRWLILQAENDNRRLQYDIGAIRGWLAPAEWEKFNDLVQIHTLETEWDCQVALNDLEAVARMASMIDETGPDIVGVDSFYNVGIGDLNRDVDMRQSCMELSRLVKRGNPRRATVVLHHALTGKAGAMKSTGWDRSSYGRNSKLLHSWTRGQINVAPGNDEGTAIVMTCGKASNGREFEPRAAVLDPTGILLPDPSFDLSEWQAEVSDGASRKSATVGVDDVVKLCRGLERKALASAIVDEFGVCRAMAYRVISSAEKKKLIVRSPLNQKFNPR